jgi:CBS domain-containing protein
MPALTFSGRRRSQLVDILHNLNTEPVRQAGPQEPWCVEPEVPAGQVLRRLAELGRGAVLVCRQGTLAGIFTERDALRLLASGGDLNAPIERFMTPEPSVLRESDTVGAAIGRMSANGYRRLPVVDAAGRPTGVLDAAGVIHWLVQHFPSTVYNLPPSSKLATDQREGP